MPQPQYHGIIPPIVTPLDEQGGIDFRGLSNLVDRLVTGGVHGIFALGTTGEGPSLSMAMRQQVVSAVCDQVKGRVPVMVGITDTIFDGSVDVAEMAYAAGAVAVVLAPPYYLPMTQNELVDYTIRLADVVQLPIMLYNMPGCCKTWFEPATVRRLSDHANVIGLKDSSGDLDYFEKVVGLMSDRPEFCFFLGPEELMVSAIRKGCHGGVNGGANMFPRLYVSMYEAAARGDWPEAERLQNLILRVSSTIYEVSEGPSRIIKGIKSVLQHLGVCNNSMAEPFEAHDAAELQEVAKHIDQLLGQLGELALPCTEETS